MFDQGTGVPISKEAEDIVSQAWANDGATAPQCFRISYQVLEEATEGFSPAMRIGGGGSCEVFRGMLYNAHVAIKVLNQGKTTASEEK